MRELKKVEAAQVHEYIGALVEKIAARHAQTPELAIVGIANGGIRLSERLYRALKPRLAGKLHHGIVNIALQRDDIGLTPIPLDAENTEIPFDVENTCIVLVDDVFCSGRTVRAGMNELFEYGRPARVEVAVLCDRGNRSLPIVPDYVGVEIPTTPDQKIELFLDEENPSRDTLRLFCL